jgi:flagellar basal body-associated protein FliL
MSDTAKKSNTTMWIIVGFIAFVAIAACVYFFWYKPKQDEKKPPVPGEAPPANKTVNTNDSVLIKTLAAETDPARVQRILRAVA